MPSSRVGRITYWPEAVQYQRNNYAQAKNTTTELRDLRGTEQKGAEDEKQFFCRGNDAFSHGGKAFTAEEVVDIFNDGMTPAMNYMI